MSRWLLLSLLVPSLALADEPIVELDLVTGVATPLGGGYDEGNDAALKLGLRAHHSFVSTPRFRLASEVAIDWVDRDSSVWNSLGEETFRVRTMLGLRVGLPLSPRLEVFLRALGGAEYLWTGSIAVQPPGEPGQIGTLEQRVWTPAVESAAGMAYQIDRWTLGVQLGTSLAFHEDRPSSGVVLDGAVEEPIAEDTVPRILVYGTIVDLDALLTVGARF